MAEHAPDFNIHIRDVTSVKNLRRRRENGEHCCSALQEAQRNKMRVFSSEIRLVFQSSSSLHVATASLCIKVYKLNYLWRMQVRVPRLMA